MGISAAAGALIGTLVTIPIQFIVGKVKETERERQIVGDKETERDKYKDTIYRLIRRVMKRDRDSMNQPDRQMYWQRDRKTEGQREREKKSRRGKERLKDIQTDTLLEKLNERETGKARIPIYRQRQRKQRD